MTEKPDLVIRNGNVIDGTGGKSYLADIGVKNGLISEIGSNIQTGKEEIDAEDRVVTPGFIDVHTHYDAQVTWSNRITPSSWNGVTTVLIGNCGVGFAPCKPHQRDQLVDCSQFEGCGSCHGLRSPLLRGNNYNKVIAWSKFARNGP